MNPKIRKQLSTTRAKIQKNLLTKLGTLDRMFDVNKIREDLTKEFATERRAIVLKLLGVDICSYGVSIDSNSVVRNFIMMNCRQSIDQWLIEEVAPLLHARGKASLLDPKLQKEIVGVFDREFRQQIQRQAQAIANAVATEAITKIATEFKNALLAPEKEEEEEEEGEEDTDDHDR